MATEKLERIKRALSGADEADKASALVDLAALFSPAQVATVRYLDWLNALIGLLLNAKGRLLELALQAISSASQDEHCRCIMKRARVEKTLTNIFLATTGPVQATCRSVMVAIMKPVDEAIEKEVEAAFQGNAGSSSSAASASLTFASLRGDLSARDDAANVKALKLVAEQIKKDPSFVRGLEEMGGLELIKTLFLVGRSPDSQSLALAAFQALTGGERPKLFMDMLPSILGCFRSPSAAVLNAALSYMAALFKQPSVLIQMRHINWISGVVPLLVHRDATVIANAIDLFLSASKDDQCRFVMQKAQVHDVLRDLTLRMPDALTRRNCLEAIGAVSAPVKDSASEDLLMQLKVPSKSQPSPSSGDDDPFGDVQVKGW